MERMETTLPVGARGGAVVIHHLALRAEWETALAAGGPYRRSTLGRSLDEVGFIHCSFADQVSAVADLAYRHRADVLLLTIDPTKLDAEVVVEDLVGDGQRFPHVYGPLPVEAVVRTIAVPMAPDGRLDVDAVLNA